MTTSFLIKNSTIMKKYSYILICLAFAMFGFANNIEAKPKAKAYVGEWTMTMYSSMGEMVYHLHLNAGKANTLQGWVNSDGYPEPAEISDVEFTENTVAFEMSGMGKMEIKLTKEADGTLNGAANNQWTGEMKIKAVRKVADKKKKK